MYPIICRLFGSCAIQSYGTLIVIGLLVFLWAAVRDKRRTRLLPGDLLYEIVFGSILAAVIGGKLLHLVSDAHEYDSWFEGLAFWQGGFSILGSVIAVTGFIGWFLYKHNIPLLATCDYLALYAPLLQMFGRIGCFLAGCCYGIATDCAWGIVYTHPDVIAPLHVCLHPTQLYSAFCYAIIFGILWLLSSRLKKPGSLALTYLLLAAVERFLVDFFRQDRVMITSFFSFHQIVALVLIAGIFSMWWLLNSRRA